MLNSFTTLKKDEIDSIALGGFDGIHLAHQALIERLTPHGALLAIHRGGTGLTPGYERCCYHDRACILLDFDDICDMEAEDFIHFLIEEFRSLKKIIVGYDFRFGKERRGDIALLTKLFTGEVEVVDEILYEDISVHAKKIKLLLLEGKIEKANKLLGRAYSIKGDVISGQGIAKDSLYPTLNSQHKDFFIPKEGVYATKIKIAGDEYPSVTFIGKRLSTDGNFSIESHVLEKNFQEPVKNVEIIFRSYLRENRKFETLRDLKDQISLDIKKAKSKH